MPNGISGPDEAKLGGTPQFLSAAHQEAVTSWWLAVRQHANTPNWDIVSTATIDGNRGLVLVEAKAHDTEMKRGGKPPGRAENDARIETACTEASRSLNSILDGWSLSVKSHYQLCNRFAWAWKIASLGVPVVLVYLGFIGATEMTDQGIPFVDADHWNRLVRSHCQGIVPDAAWDKPLQIAGTPLHAMIRSMEMPLSSS
jgi:hypothetical protein